MDDEKKETFYNRSLERALQILDTFDSERKELSLAQLSEVLGFSKATVLRLCSTLVKYGYLKQDFQSKKYSLGIKVFELGSIVFSSFSLRKMAHPFIGELQAKTGKTVFLGILENDQLLYVDKREDPRNGVSFTSNIGTRHPPYWGMLGPVLMAYLPGPETERLLDKSPLKATAGKSITSESEFKEWLKVIRGQGFVIEAETALEGIAGVAAPVRDFTGGVIAAIGVGFISSSANAKGIQQMVKEVTDTAAAISRELGFIDKNEA